VPSGAGARADHVALDTFVHIAAAPLIETDSIPAIGPNFLRKNELTLISPRKRTKKGTLLIHPVVWIIWKADCLSIVVDEYHAAKRSLMLRRLHLPRP
jgi:hypothetical protein